jgi:8-oxo-dGTP pyrophosphatase MutT (NUDIX family)
MQSEGEARIVNRDVQRVSPWVSIVAKEVDFALGGPTETYHCLQQSDYIAILARTPDGRIPIVKQFRPAVESYTWELPAGLIERGESPEACCRRELIEEVGVSAQRIVDLGIVFPDTGRLGNRMHAFFVVTDEPRGMQVEQGITVQFVQPDKLAQMILRGEFCHQLHLGVFVAAQVRGLWNEW